MDKKVQKHVRSATDGQVKKTRPNYGSLVKNPRYFSASQATLDAWEALLVRAEKKASESSEKDDQS